MSERGRHREAGQPAENPELAVTDPDDFNRLQRFKEIPGQQLTTVKESHMVLKHELVGVAARCEGLAMVKRSINSSEKQHYRVQPGGCDSTFRR